MGNREWQWPVEIRVQVALETTCWREQVESSYPHAWTVVAIALGGEADGEGAKPPSPVSPGSDTRNPLPRSFTPPGSRRSPPSTVLWRL